MSKQTSQIEIQVVLEYQWTSTRDLISSVQAEQLASETAIDKSVEGKSITGGDVTLRSIVESLASKGLEIEPEHRISFQDPAKSLYVFIGKASDHEVINAYTLPASAFSQGSDGPVLTLLLRQAGSGLSGQKQPASENKSLAAEKDCQKKLFDSPSQQADKPAQQIAEQNDDDSAMQDESAHKVQQSEKASVKIPAASSAAAKANTRSPNGVAKPSPSLLDAIDLKRTKERQIRFVVERVSLWRKLYNGVELGNGETVRYSLEDSARLVGISKKSLDDYLLQLRFGRMYGFDFLKHQCDNIGVLRKFVREHKQKQKRTQQKQSKDEAASSQYRPQEEDEQDKSAGQSTPSAKGGKQQPEIIDQGMVDESSRENSQQIF